MSYEKTLWIHGETITAEKLNNIENGIAALTSSAVEAIVPEMKLEWDDERGSYYAEFSPASNHIPTVTEVYAVVVDGIESLWVVASAENITGEGSAEYTQANLLKLGDPYTDRHSVTYRYSANSSNPFAQVEYTIDFNGGVLPPPISFSMNRISVTDWRSNGIAPSKIRSTSGTLVRDSHPPYGARYYMDIAFNSLVAPVPGELCQICVGDAVYVGECNWEATSVTVQEETATIFMPWIWTPIGMVQYSLGDDDNVRVCIQQGSIGPSLAGEDLTIDIFNLPYDYICSLQQGYNHLYTNSPAEFINIAMSHYLNESAAGFDYIQSVGVTRREFPMFDERSGGDMA